MNVVHEHEHKNKYLKVRAGTCNCLYLNPDRNRLYHFVISEYKVAGSLEEIQSAYPGKHLSFSSECNKYFHAIKEYSLNKHCSFFTKKRIM